MNKEALTEPTLEELKQSIIDRLTLHIEGFRFSFDTYDNLCMQEQPMDIGLLLRTLWEDKKYKLAHDIIELFQELEKQRLRDER